MSRPSGLGKVASNGTLNENGAFYSVQDINVLLENGGGSSGGELPTPTIADVGSVVVVDEDGKYALGEAGGGLIVHITPEENVDSLTLTLDKSYSEIKTAILAGITPIFISNEFGEYLIYHLSTVADAHLALPYVVWIYCYIADDSSLNGLRFTCDTESGVLTCTSYDEPQI